MCSSSGDRPSLRPVLAMVGSDDTRHLPKSIAVVGAGVSGLSAAYRLRKSGVNVTVFEAGDTAGGKIRSNSEGGFFWDEGANTVTESELEVNRIIDDLGLQDRLYLNSQHKRYIVKDGTPVLIPSDAISLTKNSVLSTKSKEIYKILRLAKISYKFGARCFDE